MKSTSTMGVSVMTGSENPSPPKMLMITRTNGCISTVGIIPHHTYQSDSIRSRVDGIEQRDVARIIGPDLVREHDAVTMEDPLSIELVTPEHGAYNLGVTMRTRGEDRKLALGFLYSEGIISNMDKIDLINSEDDVISVYYKVVQNSIQRCIADPVS